MMLPPLERAKHYRFRAEELRACAESMNTPDCRTMLFALAIDYEMMAKRIENQHVVGVTEVLTSAK